MTEQVHDGRRVSAADGEAAETGRVAEALTRLLPALERFGIDQAASRFPAYQSGTVASEPLALPEHGVGLDAAVDEIADAVVHGCRISAPGFVGFVTTGAATAGVVAQTAVALAGGQRYLLHAFNALEWTGLRWLAELCGLPSDAHGVFTSGGSTAQLLALGAARQSAFERLGVDVASDGLPPGVQARIYVSVLGHRTIQRSAGVLGLGRHGVVEIPAAPCGQVDVQALDETLRRDVAAGIVPVAVVAVAGTTDTGSVDPIDDLAEVARRHRAWLHVDGAYGLFANAAPSAAPLFTGVQEADSWIVDPHKWLATGVGVGAAYVRDRGVLARAFTEGEAAYLEGSFSQDAEDAQSQFDLMGGGWSDESVELSSPPRGVLVWAVLREIGRRGVSDRVERHIGFARHIADRVRADARLELLCDAQLSIVCFRYAPPAGVDGDALTERILKRLRRETPFVPTSTVIDGALAIRPCFINPRTTQRDVDGLVDAVLGFGDELSATS
jgi:aromatic-L-amino-acid/L-tryptophan decarboxylase